MNNKEVSVKLLEIYYTNKPLFSNLALTIFDLTEKYIKILKILEDSNNE